MIIKEESVDFQEVSDLLGVDVMGYTNKNVEIVFYQLGKALKRVYKQLKD